MCSTLSGLSCDRTEAHRTRRPSAHDRNVAALMRTVLATQDAGRLPGPNERAREIPKGDPDARMATYVELRMRLTRNIPLVSLFVRE